MDNTFNQCNSGTRAEDDYFLAVRDNIFEFGLHIVGVAGDPVSWAYTIGLAEQGLPELVVTDVPYECAGTLLNSIARQMTRGADAGELAAEIDCHLQDVHQNHIANSDLLASWAGYYGSIWGPAAPLAPVVKQLVLGQSQYCIGDVRHQTDLSRPLVRMLRPARRVHKRSAA